MTGPGGPPGAGAAGAPDPPAQRRVRVTASRGAARPAPTRRPAAAVIEQTAAGQLYLRGLLRAQLRLALRVGVAMGTALLGLSLLFALAPASGRAAVFGLPLPWLVLGVAFYPAMVVASVWFTARAEQLERRFSTTLDWDTTAAADTPNGAPTGPRPVTR